MIAFSIVKSAKKEVTVTIPQQSWLATRLICINSYKEERFAWDETRVSFPPAKDLLKWHAFSGSYANTNSRQQMK